MGPLVLPTTHRRMSPTRPQTSGTPRHRRRRPSTMSKERRPQPTSGRTLIVLLVLQGAGLVALTWATLRTPNDAPDDARAAPAPLGPYDTDTDVPTGPAAAPSAEEPDAADQEPRITTPEAVFHEVTMTDPAAAAEPGSQQAGPRPTAPSEAPGTPPTTTEPSPTTTTTTSTTTPTTSPTSTAPVPITREGTVNGCNTYGANCDGNPIYAELPPPNYDWAAWPTITRVDNGTVLTARCWAIGALVHNYRVDPPDHGPDPYSSDIHFNVQAPDGRWGWIPDTYFVREQGNRMGLPKCSTTA